MTNRIIKFRAWSETKRRMAKVQSYNFETMAAHLIFDNHQSATVGTFVPMQFTGLLDKNGKEIYEGDIIEFKRGEHPLWAGQEGRHLVSFPYICGNSDQGEIIGNVMETPDLLK